MSTTREKLQRARQIAIDFAKGNGGIVDARSIRPALTEAGLLDGGDERWIGFLFSTKRLFHWTGRTAEVTTTPDLRRNSVRVWELTPAAQEVQTTTV